MTVFQNVDVTPGAHSIVDALATVSFKLACGCNTRMTRPEEAGEAFLLKYVGCTYPCNRHGEQVITRSTLRLVGWRDAPPLGWRP
jgi:hypothetical protein